MKLSLNAIAALVPETAFSNALGISNMAFGGLVPFTAFLILICIRGKTASEITP